MSPGFLCLFLLLPTVYGEGKFSPVHSLFAFGVEILVRNG